MEQLCELLQADGIPPPDLISAFGSPDYRHYVVEREGQVRSVRQTSPGCQVKSRCSGEGSEVMSRWVPQLFELALQYRHKCAGSESWSWT